MSTIAAPRSSARPVARPAARPAARPTARPAARPAAARPAAAPVREVDLWAEADRSELRRIYRRRRVGVAALLVLGLSSVGYGFADADPHPSVARPGAAVHVVRAGETLWGIARAAQPEGDVRPLVDRLARQLEGDTLVPGTRLVVA